MDVILDLATAEVGGRYASQSFARQIARSKRSWWEVMYEGGRTVGEWQTTSIIRSLALPLSGLQPYTRWEELDHSRITDARLWCPDGMIADVHAGGRNRIFQFKAGIRSQGREGSLQEAHVLGVVIDDNGTVRAWEWRTQEWKLIQWTDNFFHMHLRGYGGPFNPEALGVQL